MAEKLYPPIIPGTLPAFYTTEDEENENGTETKITVPFSMNRAVSSKDIKGFALKLKTAYSNTLIDVLKIYGFNSTSKEITFNWNNDNNNNTLLKIKPGQFLKAQLAYISGTAGEAETIGYYSTVGVIKYTDKPELKIQEFELENNSNENDSNKIRTFCSTCTGIYTPGKNDKSERPYQYQFLLLDENDKEVENSGWLLHNNELDMGDTYAFKSKMEVLTIYKVQYNVKTVNDLNAFVEYQCSIPQEKIENHLILQAKNIFEEGYINLFFSKKSNNNIIINENNPFIIDIYREEIGTNNYCLIHRVKFQSKEEISKWSFKDFTVEQGITYLYSFKYNQLGYHSQACGEKKDGIEYPIQITADFEDMFLYDGQRQIKLRFNPKVSSFKINHLEQKTDVIGNRYPIFFRNNIVEYKEFPISGLISYHLDDNELFIQDSLQELGIQRNILERLGTNHDHDENSSFSTEQEKYFNSQSSSVKNLNLISNNIKAERLFKLKLLDWLGNGEIKLFKSPSEGNYLVRLMNISLSPEDKLNRMLHTFSCTAYEAKEFNFENLEKLGFINIDQNIKNNIIIWETFQGEQEINNEETALSLQDKKIINYSFHQKEIETIIIKYIQGNPTYLYNNQPINISEDNFSNCLEKNKLYIMKIFDDQNIQQYGYINNKNQFKTLWKDTYDTLTTKDNIVFTDNDNNTYTYSINSLDDVLNLNLQEYKQLSLGINLYIKYNYLVFTSQEEE